MGTDGRERDIPEGIYYTSREGYPALGMNAHLLRSGKSSRMPTNSDQTLTNDPVPLRGASGGLEEVLQVVIGPRNEAVPRIWLFLS